jgi:putative membrane protein
MTLISRIVVGIVALIHILILWLEMFAWETRGPAVFTFLSEELFTPTKVMAANQGLYNGFLAAGLIWSQFIGNPIWARNVAAFFLLCVAIAGLYGAATISGKILIVQTLPAAIGLIFLLVNRKA